MTTKTVKQHTDDGDTIAKHIRDANALLVKLRDELDFCRTTLHRLRDFAPADRFKIDPPYHLKQAATTEGMNMLTMIKSQTVRINTLLGDRVAE